jgi:hypothetical protein
MLERFLSELGILGSLLDLRPYYSLIGSKLSSLKSVMFLIDS